MKPALRLISTLAIIALGSCTVAGGDPASSTEANDITVGAIALPPPSCGCDAITPVAWTTGVTGYWDGNATTMTVVFTAVDDGTTDFLAWGIGNAQHVAWVYRAPAAAYQSFMANLNRAFVVAQGVGAERSWSVAGGLNHGGPGPIGPGGIPPLYVARIVRTAGAIVDTTNAALSYR